MTKSEKAEYIRSIFESVCDVHEDKSLEWQMQHTVDLLIGQGWEDFDHGDLAEALYDTRVED